MAAVECKSCGHVFELTEQRHYIAREKTEMFLIASNKMEPTLYDAFDCPICGCQYIANERKRVFRKEIKMTREEAIDTLKNGLWWDRKRLDEAIDIAIAALRPVSREQVEKVWRGKWKYSHTSEIDHFAVVKCSKCGYEAFAISLFVKDGNFCPSCGAPMTDEAVQMVMERLEALKDG